MIKLIIIKRFIGINFCSKFSILQLCHYYVLRLPVIQLVYFYQMNLGKFAFEG